MANRVEGASHDLQPFYVNVRVKMSALWTVLLFVFAYVDIFSLYRPDFRADIAAGEISGFSIGEGFLLAITVYVLIPSLLVFGSLVLPPRVSQVVNIAASVVYGLTIAAGAIGEWSYYILGSVVEIGLLAVIVYYAWTWPRLAPSIPSPDRANVLQRAALPNQ